MKQLIALVFMFGCVTAYAQKVMTEGTIVFTLNVTNGKTQPGIADAFDGATLTDYMKGNMVRSELNSMLRNQSIIYDGKDQTATILKESGQDKYMLKLTQADWAHYNRKYDGITYTYTEESKTIAGYNCKKAIGKLKDGTEIVVYYTPDLLPFVKGFDYQFKDLPGIALQYEVQTAGVTVQYTATRVSFGITPASKFDLPKSGYKILDYKQS